MTVESGAQVPERILQYLSGHSIMTLATASSGGIPHAATLVYVNDGSSLYIGVRPESITASHLGQNPVVSFTVDDYNSDWREMSGIQADGDAYVVLSNAALSHVSSLFQQKFPWMAETGTRNLSFFRITPASLRFIDSQRGSGEQGIQAIASDWNRTLVYSIFRDLPHREAEDVMGTLATVHADQGETIVRQGAPADKFFIIADGEVEVVRDVDGEEKHVANLGTGQFFGEMAVLHDEPRTASVRAVRPTTLMAMPGEVFRGLVAQSLSTSADFEQLMRQRFSELEELSKG
jgi:nitroimidazol reductase NimA-like FMN-containing flavoprotein (pyridoxamine 5'-phosphate oxidase superfamily)